MAASKSATTSTRPQGRRELPSLLYDTLYGLVLFFGLAPFLSIREPAHFVFYLFTMVIVVHWWMMFKAAEDLFVPGVRDTAVHVAVNVAYVLLLELMVLYAQRFEYMTATVLLLTVIAADLLWAWGVQRAGRWKAGTKTHAAAMRRELDNIVRTDLAVGIPLALLVFLGTVVSPTSFVSTFVFLYVVYIVLTFKYDIIDMRFF